MMQFLPWAIIATLLSGAGGLWFGVDLGADREIAKQAKIEEVRREVEDAARLGAAAAINEIEITNRTINREVETITREVPIYRDCVNTSDIERLLDAARANRAGEPNGAGRVP